MIDLPCRHIHLDFHTSPAIPDVGIAFDPEAFADRLAQAHVESVTLFARCHHGHLYYPSLKNPERIHPHLAQPNLLHEQIAACHDRGIRVPIYTTVQWDQFTADTHRDWLVVDERGATPLTAGFYRFLDVLHPGYRQFLKDHVAELFEMFPVDGLFFDIVQPKPSLAPHWIEAMDAAGADMEDPAARQRFAVQVIDDFKREMSDFIASQAGYDPDHCTIFYNAGHVGTRHRATVDAYSHYELESLPSGGWGYLHFPLSMRYAKGLGKPCLGMTGKFHTAWGDFHSLKNPAALQFECFHMLALGAGCSIGDQLHPDGRLDEPTYRLIGDVYASVKSKQPWCANVTAVREIGVFTPEEFTSRRSDFAAICEDQSESLMGAVQMLHELGRQFDVLSTDRDFADYKLLVLPDEIPVDQALAQKLQDYLATGGALIASHRSGLDPASENFALDLGVSHCGDAPYSPDFLKPEEALCKDLESTPYVMYQRGSRVEATAKAEVLAHVQEPFFNRTWRHFCSHRHSPSSYRVGYPGVVQHGRAIYFAHPLFCQYRTNAPRWCRQFLANAIDRLIGPPLVQTDGPSTLINVLQYQPTEQRRILHLLHYIPQRRGTAFDVIEDVIPLHDLHVSIELPDKPTSISVVPEGRPLPWQWSQNRASFTLDRLDGHVMIELTEGG